jgi:hypothetical protein
MYCVYPSCPFAAAYYCVLGERRAFCTRGYQLSWDVLMSASYVHCVNPRMCLHCQQSFLSSDECISITSQALQKTSNKLTTVYQPSCLHLNENLQPSCLLRDVFTYSKLANRCVQRK